MNAEHIEGDPKVIARFKLSTAQLAFNPPGIPCFQFLFGAFVTSIICYTLAAPSGYYFIAALMAALSIIAYRTKKATQTNRHGSFYSDNGEIAIESELTDNTPVRLSLFCRKRQGGLIVRRGLLGCSIISLPSGHYVLFPEHLCRHPALNQIMKNHD